jgi:hypothetical protein
MDNAELESKVIQVVRNWYFEHGAKGSNRIVIETRRESSWDVVVGREDHESLFTVDIQSMRVIKHKPGI